MGSTPYNSLIDVTNSFFKDKQPVRPYFIITYGPPGSGKSSVLDSVLKDLGILRKNVVEVLVDEVIQRSPRYLDDVAAIVTQHAESMERERSLTAAYFKYRYSSADAIADGILYRAFIERYDVIWETTGNDVSWILKTINEARREGYAIVVVYPFVTLGQLLSRVMSRASSNPVNPRLPDTAYITANFHNAQRNFETIVGASDMALVYQNETPSPSLVLKYRAHYLGTCKSAPGPPGSCRDGIYREVSCSQADLRSIIAGLDPDYRKYLLSACSLSLGFDVNAATAPYPLASVTPVAAFPPAATVQPAVFLP